MPSRVIVAGLLAGALPVVAGCGGTVEGSSDGGSTDGGFRADRASSDVAAEGAARDSQRSPDGAGDAGQDAKGEDAGGDSSASDGAGPEGSTGEAGAVIPIASCAMSAHCGNPGDTCCSGAMPCFCQDYGQERCLGSPLSTTGHAGDACTPAHTCDPGLACVAFGPGTICLHCGD